MPIGTGGWGMQEHRRAILWLGASAAALSIGVGAAQAQTTQNPSRGPVAVTSQSDSGSAAVAELVVTATRREAVNVMQVPLAVDAYSGKTLQMLDVTSVSDLSKLDPSLNIQAYGPAEERIIIRGISSVVGATTGVYLDETPLQGGFNADIPGDNTPTVGLYDIDQHVEGS